MKNTNTRESYMNKNTMPVVKFAVLRAINASGMPWQQRYVLFQFWELADAKTGEIFKPYSFSGLATIMGMAERTIQKWVKESVAGGWLECTPPETAAAIRKHEKNRYRLLVPASVPTVPAVATVATAQNRHDDKTAGRAVANAAPVQHLPTSHEKTITRRAAPLRGAVLDMKEKPGDRDPLVCTSCDRKIWDCSGSEGNCPQRWVCLCGKNILTDWINEDDGTTTTVLYCETCGELTKMM